MALEGREASEIVLFVCRIPLCSTAPGYTGDAWVCEYLVYLAN